MKTTFEKLNDCDIFRNADGQIMVKGFGIWWNTGKIIHCPEGSVGRFYVKPNAPVFRLLEDCPDIDD